MKKMAMGILAFSLMAGSAWALSPAEAEKERYEQVKAVKKAQREAREKKKNVPQGEAHGFWKREAERSGFSQMKNPLNSVGSLNPMPFLKRKNAEYKARQAAAPVQS